MPIEVPDELVGLTHMGLMARLLEFADEVKVAASKLHEFGDGESGSKHALEILDRAILRLYREGSGSTTEATHLPDWERSIK